MGFLHWELRSHSCTELTWTSEIWASTPKISFFLQSWMYFFAWAFFWTTSVISKPMHHWFRLLTSASFLLKKRPGSESLCVVFLREYEREIAVSGFYMGFVSQSASGGKVKDLIRLLTLEEVQMGSWLSHTHLPSAQFNFITSCTLMHVLPINGIYGGITFSFF